MKVIFLGATSYLNANAHLVPGRALQLAADAKEREYRIKLGAAGPAAVALPRVTVFHPWVCDIYGSVHPTLDADLHGLAEHIMLGSLNRGLSSSAGEARSAAIVSKVQSQFSFELQRHMFSFLEGRLQKCV
jgi:hypothetical protein